MQGEKLANERVKSFRSKSLEEVERNINSFAASEEAKKIIGVSHSEDEYSFSAMVLYEPAENLSHQAQNT